MAVLPAQPSTVPVVLSGLLALLKARPGLSGVSVSLFAPAGDLPREMILIGDVDGTVTSAAIGSQRREERYTIMVWVSVVHATTDSSDPITRAYALQQEVAAQLRSDATLGLSALRWALDGGYVLRNRLVDGENGGIEREAQIEMRIECAARI